MRERITAVAENHRPERAAALPGHDTARWSLGEGFAYLSEVLQQVVAAPAHKQLSCPVVTLHVCSAGMSHSCIWFQ